MAAAAASSSSSSSSSCGSRSSSSSSSSSTSSWKYDVLLSFRGEDTRKSFVGHLYRALDQKAINTFIDAEQLRKGNDLSQLLRAINESRVSIVVFSQNYASSSWCLKELVQIMKCMDTKKQIVVPVFYQVDPSDIRKLKGSFAQAFAQHNSDSNADVDQLQTWRSALTRATNLSGWDSRNYEDDAKLIEDIVQDIFKKLIHGSSTKANDSLVEMDSRKQDMDSLLCRGVNDVRVVGIWGMGGLGKTTIARAVYDEIASQFQASCFLENVKESFMKKGAVHMREELLSRILNEKERSLGTLDRGSQMIMERLRRKRVLVVLDDVDKLEQIETLLGKQHSFGGGSRIIITTRDAELLSGADAIYEPENLSDYGGLELFRMYAFKTNQPTSEYNHLSRSAIQYAQGLPLALKVLGAFLHNKTVREWQDVLKKIKKIPHRGIQDVLRTSFDGLDDSEKDVFLDIACFFKGMEKDYATKIMESCDLYPHSGLRVLVDRALVTISYDSRLEMHDLIQEMGWEIVRQESIKEPGKRSRLWSYEDVHHVLTQNTGTEAVESIMLDLSNSEKAYFSLLSAMERTESFIRMTKLRLFHINHRKSIIGSDSYYSSLSAPWILYHLTPTDDYEQNVIGDLKFLSHELRCLLWPGCPLKSLPSDFHPKNLVDLDMRYSHIEQLWQGTKPLHMLESINLGHSQYLNTTPDFTGATNLEKLNLEGCIRLFEVHSSISTLENLVYLNLYGCIELRILPSSIHMKSLRSLILSGCSNLEKFPEISEVMEKLSELYLDGTGIKELPSSINNLHGLVVLNLNDCKELKSLPSSIYLRSLQVLHLSGCSNLEKFPEVSKVMEDLPRLSLDGTAIKELPSSIKNLRGLRFFNLRGCKELKSLPSSICQLKSLLNVTLSGCTKFEVFPNIEENMEEFRELHLNGTSIKELPPSIERLQRLQLLNLRSCKSLVRLPDNIFNLASLNCLNLRECSNLLLPEYLEYLESFVRRCKLESRGFNLYV